MCLQLISFYVLLLSLKDLRERVQADDAQKKKTEYDAGPKASYGYGGEFGVQKDRMDQVCSIEKYLQSSNALPTVSHFIPVLSRFW